MTTELLQIIRILDSCYPFKAILFCKNCTEETNITKVRITVIQLPTACKFELPGLFGYGRKLKGESNCNYTNMCTYLVHIEIQTLPNVPENAVPQEAQTRSSLRM